MLNQGNNAICDAANGFNAVLCGIPSLLFDCFPTAIIRLVTLASINPSKRCSFGSCSHILIKLYKRFPSFTYLNPFVVIVLRFFPRRLTSRKHVCPRAIGLSVAHFVFGNSSPKLFVPNTATGFSGPKFKRSVQNGFCLSTIAKAFASSSSFLWNISDSFKSSKSLPDEGFSFRHNIASSMFCQWRDSDCNPFPLRFYEMTR